MAYLINITKECFVHGCSSKAVVELFDWRNQSRGCFCKKHGKQKLAERDRFERENPDLVHLFMI